MIAAALVVGLVVGWGAAVWARREVVAWPWTPVPSNVVERETYRSGVKVRPEFYDWAERGD